jgi:hypothetical protein
MVPRCFLQYSLKGPNWRKAADFPYLPSLFGNGTAASYVGYVPTFIETNDYNATLGFKSSKKWLDIRCICNYWW